MPPGLFGQVAQLVEQGTENPRVGGSIPSLATLFLCVFVAGCGADPCRSLCTNVASSVSGCLDGWGSDWEDLGATSQRDFRSQCEAEWDATRSALEARQLPEAEDRCGAAAVDLARLDCDALRAIWAEP